MARLHAPKYLVKRGEIFYFRIAIPTDLRPAFGCKELKASLRTDNRQFARLRCRLLSNKFEELFVLVAAMTELTQNQLAEIAQSYFRDLLIAGNDRIFWLEEILGNSPDDREETIASMQDREARLRELDAQGKANNLFTEATKLKLTEIKSIGTTDIGIFRDTLLKIPKNYTKGTIQIRKQPD